ncbi:MAG TPA: hypothetical protein VD839_08355 [Burkholderiales bacterium]|jgi:hypothetical protein|nr:hypothetical protein [Burkholderiales bacterium]
MRNLNVARGATLAGTVLFVMPVLDILLGGGAAGAVHAIVGGFGLALFAVSAAADAGRR